MTENTPGPNRVRSHTPWSIRTPLVAALSVATIGFSMATGAPPSGATTRDAAIATVTTASGNPVKPTIVLVHGAFADATGWRTEIALLQGRGFAVLAPANPLRGLTSDSDYLRSILQSVDGPVILVGHSYGGAVITNAARGAANVVALVYVAAFIPDRGTSVATSYDPATYPGSLLTPESLVVRPVANAAAPGGQDADLYIAPDRFRAVFAGDQSSVTASVMAAAQRPLSAFAFTEASGAPAWDTVPAWALITLEDKAISPSGQRFMAARAGASVTTVHSAHDVMLSHPGSVVNLILHVVEAVQR